MKPITRQEHLKRINMVIDYISGHLDEKLDLDKLSGISAISPYHFHRIMSTYLGEPIGSYIIRCRIEVSSTLLKYSSQQIDEIAYKIGYDNPASFTKAFKKYFGVSPTEFRNTKKSFTMRTTIADKTLPNGFNQECLGIAYNDPNITEDDKCQYDCCVTISKDIKPEGEIGVKNIEGGKYAVFKFKGSPDKVGSIYNAIFNTWLPESNYDLRDAPCFEKYVKFSKTDTDKNRTEVFIPIK
jgi:AraC family transcriptional regulator